ncbi:hypothetical protein V8E51_007572 [Hyaloscypha variabilis]
MDRVSILFCAVIFFSSALWLYGRSVRNVLVRLLDGRHLAAPSAPTSNVFDNKSTTVMNQVGQQTVFGGIHHHANQNETVMLQLLPNARDAAYNSSKNDFRNFCLDGTRRSVQAKIGTWAERRDEQCIFWLKGKAGAGKSTIARTVARDYDKKGRLAASFFFSRDGGDVGRADKFVTTIARQLAYTSGDLRREICKAISEDEDIANKTFTDQWDRLVLGPLSRLQTAGSEPPVVVVIDALDECEANWKTLKFLIQVLTGVNRLSNIHVRILLTSRPDADVRRALANLSDSQCLPYELDLPKEDAQTGWGEVNQDISKFLKAQFDDIRGISEDSTHLPPNWPGDGVISILVKKAEGLFIYAATVSEFIKKNDQWPRDKLLELILGQNEKPWQKGSRDLPAASPFEELDALYLQVLSHSLRGAREGVEQQELLDVFKKIIGSIVVLSEPLSVAALRELLHLHPETVHLRLRHLHSVLYIPSDERSPINILHSSFREFLLSRERYNVKGQLDFWVDEVQANTFLAASSIKLMSAKLQTPDLCGLKRPGTMMIDIKASLVHECIPSELQYACVYWMTHVEKGRFYPSDKSRIEGFLRLHLLCWIEALSLIGKISTGIRILSKLQSLTEDNSKLHSFVQDAQRFLAYNRFMVELSPLQVYYSALLFAPNKSDVRQSFLDRLPQFVTYPPETPDYWGPSTQTLEGHQRSVYDVVFSPTGKLLASLSADNTVRLWDPYTGEPRGVLSGNESSVSDLTFSYDGKVLAFFSASDLYREKDSSGIITLWDSETGQLLFNLEGPRARRPLAFSPTRLLLCSGSSDHSLSLWNPTTGSFHKSLTGHSDAIAVLAFSSKNDLLASGSWDHKVNIWHVEREQLLFTLEAHSELIRDLAFAPDATFLVSVADDGVQIWDVGSGKPREPFVAQPHASCVAISRDHVVAVHDWGRDIRLWDAKTNEYARLKSPAVFGGDAQRVLVYSPAAKGQILLASGSGVNEIFLWDLEARKLHSILEAHSGFIYGLAFSPDGELLASASLDNTVRLWNMKMELPSTSHISRTTDCIIYAMAFATDRKRIAAGSQDGSISIWSLENSEFGRLHKTTSIQKSVGRVNRPVRALAFLPDGNTLACAYGNDIVALWDLTNRKPHFLRPPMSFRSVSLYSCWGQRLSLSPNKQLLAIATDEGTIILWNLQTKRSSGIIKGHDSDSLRTLAFSPDGKYVASGSNMDIQLWAVKTKTCFLRIKIQGCERYEYHEGIYKLYFSTDGMYLETNHGAVSLCCSQPFYKTQMDRLSPLTVKDNWIMYDKEKLLWLPPEYRATCDVVQDNLVALGHVTGNVTVVGINPSQIPKVDSYDSRGMLDGALMMRNPFRGPCAACAHNGRLENCKWVLADHKRGENERQETSGVPLAVAWIQSYEVTPESGWWEKKEKEDSEEHSEDDGEDEVGEDGDGYDEDDNEVDCEDEDEDGVEVENET